MSLDATPTAPAAPQDMHAHAFETSGAHEPVAYTPTWEQIVLEHSARVYRLAYRLTGNQHDAEDLTQEVFVRVFRSLHNYQPGSFEGWLHRITTNVFLDQVRRKKRIRMDHMGEEAQTYAEGNEFASPERSFEHHNLDYDIQEALQKLSPEYRVAVVLCDIEGLSYEEIATTLGIKLGTVRSRIHRARAQLRKSLAHRDPTRFTGPRDQALNLTGIGDAAQEQR